MTVPTENRNTDRSEGTVCRDESPSRDPSEGLFDEHRFTKQKSNQTFLRLVLSMVTVINF